MGGESSFSPADHRAMARALTLAGRGRDTVAPNPMVGAVVTNGGEIVGEGWHRRGIKKGIYMSNTFANYPHLSWIDVS